MQKPIPPFLTERACPTCGGNGPFVVGSKPPGETQPLSVLTQSWFGFFKTKVFFSYCRCSACELLFSPIYFTDEALQKLYSEMPDNTAGIDAEALRRTQAGYADALGDSKVDGDYVELGPDIGLLTAAVLPRLTGGRLWLFEPNVAVHGALAKCVAAQPHVISAEMTNFAAVPDGSVGLCSLIHVLDHLPDAQNVIRQLVRKLRPGGRILIVTHDESSMLARLLGARWPAFCLQHPHLFNRHSTVEFLRSCGLRAVSIRRTVNHFPLLYLVKHLLFALGIKSAAGWRVWGPTVPLRLGNLVTVAEAVA